MTFWRNYFNEIYNRTDFYLLNYWSDFEYPLQVFVIICQWIELYSFFLRHYFHSFKWISESYMLNIVWDFEIADNRSNRHAPDFWLNEDFAEFLSNINVLDFRDKSNIAPVGRNLQTILFVFQLEGWFLWHDDWCAGDFANIDIPWSFYKVNVVHFDIDTHLINLRLYQEVRNTFVGVDCPRFMIHVFRNILDNIHNLYWLCVILITSGGHSEEKCQSYL